MAYMKAYMHQTTTEEHPMKRTLTTMTVTAIASAALVLPAPARAADEPEPDPCASQNAQITQLAGQVAYWRARAAEANENAAAQAVVAVERALAAEDRAERAAVELGARTAQRDHLLVRAQRLEVQRDRLRIMVQRLRERLAATR